MNTRWARPSMFAEKTFTNRLRSTKITKVFSLESFLLYGISNNILVSCHLLAQKQMRVIIIYYRTKLCYHISFVRGKVCNLDLVLKCSRFIIILILQLSVSLCVTYERKVTGSCSTSDTKVAVLYNAALGTLQKQLTNSGGYGTSNAKVSGCKRAARQKQIEMYAYTWRLGNAGRAGFVSRRCPQMISRRRRSYPKHLFRPALQHTKLQGN